MLQVGRVGETGAKSDDVTSAGRGVRIDAGGGTVAPRGARGSRRSEGQAPAGRASRDRSHGERGKCTITIYEYYVPETRCQLVPALVTRSTGALNYRTRIKIYAVKLLAP